MLLLLKSILSIFKSIYIHLRLYILIMVLLINVIAVQFLHVSFKCSYRFDRPITLNVRMNVLLIHYYY